MERAKDLLNENGSLSEASLMLEAAIQKGELGEGGYEALILLGEARNMDEREDTGIKALIEGVRRAKEAGANGVGMLVGPPIVCLDCDLTLMNGPQALAISYTNEGYEHASHTTLLRWLQAANPDAEIPQTAWSSLQESSWYSQQQVTQAFIDYARVQHSKGIVDADLQAGLGVLFYSSNQFDRAKDCFEAALSVRPTDYQLWNRLGSSLSNGNNHEESLGAYREALNLRPTYVRAISNVAVACPFISLLFSTDADFCHLGLNIGAHKEAAEHVLSALTLQSASGHRSEYLWSALRRVMTEMVSDCWSDQAGSNLIWPRIAGETRSRHNDGARRGEGPGGFQKQWVRLLISRKIVVVSWCNCTCNRPGAPGQALFNFFTSP